MKKLCQVNRFDKIALHLQLLRPGHIDLVGRCCHDHDRNPVQFVERPDLGEYLAAIFAGQTKVEQNQVGPRCLGVFTPPEEKLDGVVPVGKPREPVLESPFFEGAHRQPRGRQAVLDEENLHGSSDGVAAHDN